MVFAFSNQVLIFFIGVVFLWLGIVTFFVFRATRHYRVLTKGTNRESLSRVLEHILQAQGQSEKKTEQLIAEVIRLKKLNVLTLQKIGLTRFNPFSDTGGDQSFSIAFLDAAQNGIIISSLVGRTGSRWYTKLVARGEGLDQELSGEEKKAIAQAQHISLTTKEKGL